MTKSIGHISALPLNAWPLADADNPVRPELFKGLFEARPGKATGLTHFGVNYVVLEPGSASSLRHWHSAEDEFVFVLEGKPTLVDDEGEHLMQPGSFSGSPAAVENGHHLVNRHDDKTVLLVIGSRRRGEDICHHPDDELGPTQR